MFDGKTYEPRDGPRLGVQLAQVAALMRGGQWRTLYEIAHTTGCPTQSVSARLRDLRKPRYGSHPVQRRGGNGLHVIFGLRQQRKVVGASTE